MNDKLTIQELAAYLPWEVKFLPTHFNIERKHDTLYYLTTIYNSEEFGVNGYTSKYIKPILYHLSSLTKEIEHKGERFVPIDYFLGEDGDLILNAVQINDMSYLPYNIIQKLLSWNFDLFGLLDRGLAVDKTTIQ